MTADIIISQMLLLDAQDPTKDIKLFINSPGGSVTAGTLYSCLFVSNTICYSLGCQKQIGERVYKILSLIMHLRLIWLVIGMGIYDAMKLCRADVSTTCFGLAASMGAFLLAAGAKGKRYCMPNARIMIHQPLGGAGGSVSFICFFLVCCLAQSPR